MRCLYVIIVIAVCGNHFTTSAPAQDFRDDVRSVLKELLLKFDKKNPMTPSVGEKNLMTPSVGEKDVNYLTTSKETKDEGGEQLTTTHPISTGAPEPPAPSLPAPRKLLPHLLCRGRLTDPNQIKDIDDIKNRHDVIEYLIYRLCLPTVSAEDVLAVFKIVERLPGPTRRPVIGMSNPFVPEVQTLVVDRFPGEGVTEVALERPTRLVDDQEAPGTPVITPDSDINDADVNTIANEVKEQPEETSEANGRLRSFLLKVDKTLFDLLDLRGEEEEEEEEEVEEENQEEDGGYDKNDEPALAREEPAIPTDAPYLTTSSPAPGEPMLHPLCKARLNNPNQIKNIADIQTRRDVIEYLIYRLCLPTFTAEDIAAVATIIEQLSLPVDDVRPKPIFEPEAYTLLINTESLQGEDEAVLDQELATEPLGDQDELVAQAESLESDNDANGETSNENEKVDDAKLTEDTTSLSSYLSQLKINVLQSLQKIIKAIEQTRKKQEERPTEQASSGTMTSSTSVESVDGFVEEALTTAQQSEDDSDKLDMAIRVLFDLLMD